MAAEKIYNWLQPIATAIVALAGWLVTRRARQVEVERRRLESERRSMLRFIALETWARSCGYVPPETD